MGREYTVPFHEIGSDFHSSICALCARLPDVGRSVPTTLSTCSLMQRAPCMGIRANTVCTMYCSGVLHVTFDRTYSLRCLATR